MTVTYHYDNPWFVVSGLAFVVFVIAAFATVSWVQNRLRERRGRRLRSMSDAEFWEAFHKSQDRLRRKHSRR